MSGVAIVMCGNVPGALADTAIAVVEDILGLDAAVCSFSIDPVFAFAPERKQYNSTLLLKRVVERKPPEAIRILGLTQGDLYIPVLSFVFGQAQVGGPGAIVSTARLRPEFYRLPPDDDLLSDRLRKEVLHELGHTMSLIHCPDPACVMSLATGIRQVDEKLTAYCDSCRALINAACMENTT